MSILKRIRTSLPEDKKKLAAALPIFAVMSALFALMPTLLFVGAVLLMMQPDPENNSLLKIVVWSSPVVLVLWMLYARKEAMIMNQLGFEVGHSLRQKIIEKCKTTSIGALRGVKASNIVQLLTEHTRWIEGFTSFAMLALVASYGIPLVLLIVLAAVDWRPAAMSVAVFAVGFMMMKLLGKQVAKVLRQRAQPVEEMNERLSDFVKGMPVIRAYGLVEDKEVEFGDTLQRLDNLLKSSLKKEVPLLTTAGSVLEIGLGLTIMLNGWLALSGSMTPANFVLATILTIMIFLPALEQVGGSVMLKFAQDAERELAEFFSLQDLSSKNSDQKPENNAITFDQVSFAYPGTAEDKQVLHGASFSIPVGGVTAIVGPSGAGKSTLLNLIARFYDPTKGAVKMADIDVRDVSSRDLLSRMSIVLQDEHIFNDTIVENIRVGRPDATDDEVIEASKMAQCYDFISKFPDGFETRCGAEGKALSGGERQRIAIARAILKDGPIVVLDEATAAIDPINSAAIQNAIGALSRGKTFVVIAHHLSAVAQADQIIVLNDGAVEASGKHADLLEQSPTYKRLWDAHRSSLEWSIS